MSTSLKHIFVTSDHHFGSWQLPGPFQVFSKDEERDLIEKWNLTVGKDDLVYYNGDFADCGVLELCEHVKRLHGRIVLIKGNHDTLPDDVYRAVFKDVANEIVLDDLDLVLHHVPRKTSHHEVFGHLHRHGCKGIGSPTSFCSCVQSNDGFPVSLEQVLMSFK